MRLFALLACVLGAVVSTTASSESNLLRQSVISSMERRNSGNRRPAAQGNGCDQEGIVFVALTNSRSSRNWAIQQIKNAVSKKPEGLKIGIISGAEMHHGDYHAKVVMDINDYYADKVPALTRAASKIGMVTPGSQMDSVDAFALATKMRQDSMKTMTGNVRLVILQGEKPEGYLGPDDPGFPYTQRAKTKKAVFDTQYDAFYNFYATGSDNGGSSNGLTDVFESIEAAKSLTQNPSSKSEFIAYIHAAFTLSYEFGKYTPQFVCVPNSVTAPPAKSLSDIIGPI